MSSREDDHPRRHGWVVGGMVVAIIVIPVVAVALLRDPSVPGARFDDVSAEPLRSACDEPGPPSTHRIRAGRHEWYTRSWESPLEKGRTYEGSLVVGEAKRTATGGRTTPFGVPPAVFTSGGVSATFYQDLPQTCEAF